MKPLLISRSRLQSEGRMVVDVTTSCDELQNAECHVIDGTFWLRGVCLPLSTGMNFQGSLGARWSGTCIRCAGEAQGDLILDADEHFLEDYEEGETYPVGRDFVDLEPMVRELLMLDLPMMVRCSEDCKGVCSACGTNLNEATCACERELTKHLRTG